MANDCGRAPPGRCANWNSPSSTRGHRRRESTADCVSACREPPPGVLAAPLLASLSAVFPKVSFQVTVADTDQLVEGMLKGTVDVAMINPVPDDRLFYHDLLVEDLVLVGGPMSNLQPDRAITFVELVDFPLVLPSSHTGIGNTVENTALRFKVTLGSRFATDSAQVSQGSHRSGARLRGAATFGLRQ